MVRNINVYNQHVKKHVKEYSYLKALRALCEGRNTNPAHKDALNLLISVLRKKNPQWDRKSIDDRVSTSRLYLWRKILTENFDSCDEHWFHIKLKKNIYIYSML